jgi:hypothetical protein
MQPNTQEAPGYFVWQTPGKAFEVQLNLDVVDRLNADVMKGFGAVPKRGAEVGGVLLGSIEQGEKTIVRVDDFEAVTCEYGRGPSFYLSETEQDTLATVAAGQSGKSRAVGYYRSHTRDGAMSLGSEDLDLITRHFPDTNQVAMLVKPFATKVSLAGFFVREGGAFPVETPLEFPFRRREMLGEEAPARRSMYERKPRSRERREEPSLETRGQVQAPEYAAAYQYAPAPATYLEEFAEPPPKRGNSWKWVPLGIIFVALFTALGYQLAVTFGPLQRGGGEAGAFALNLAAGRGGESLTVTWNRDSVAVRAAERGILEIEDGDFSKQVQLDAAQLKEGTVIYITETYWL